MKKLKFTVRPSLTELNGMNQTLATLAVEAQEICKLLIECHGELTPELEQRLDVNAQALMAKTDNYVFIEEHLEMHAALWKRKADACKAIADRFVKSQEKLRDRVKQVMVEIGKTELKGNYHRYCLSPLKAKLVITEPAKIPSECKMIVNETVPDKEKIKSLLDEGFDVPGATLEPVYRLQVRENADEE